MSRHQIGVATPLRPLQVATSISCRDILETNLCRDIVLMSRPPRMLSMSRRQNDVATSSLLSHCHPCRDIQFMSRHQFLLAVSRHQNGVATPLQSPSVATSKMVSRPQVTSAPFLRRHDVAFPCRDVSYCYPCRDLKLMSRHPIQPAATQPDRDVHFLVATSRPTTPGRDLITMSRPQEVLTH